jgi:uncharacterized membrane protein
VSRPGGPDPFWLSHHPPEEYGRTFRIGGVHVCARCLGTYPVLFAALAAQFVFRVPLAWEGDQVLAVALVLPALLDWAHGRFRPWSGTNALRLATGVLLGAGLGRTLYVHLQRPFPRALLLQMAVVTAVALPVIFATWRRRPGA